MCMTPRTCITHVTCTFALPSRWQGSINNQLSFRSLKLGASKYTSISWSHIVNTCMYLCMVKYSVILRSSNKIFWYFDLHDLFGIEYSVHVSCVYHLSESCIQVWLICPDTCDMCYGETHYLAKDTLLLHVCHNHTIASVMFISWP